MVQSARKHMRSVALLGVAAAQGGSQGGSQSSGQEAGKRPPGPPPAMGIAMQGLTYAELHVLDKSGKAETVPGIPRAELPQAFERFHLRARTGNASPRAPASASPSSAS